MFDLTHRASFVAAHRLISPDLTPEENQQLYGPCHRLHGHNYELEVMVRGDAEARTGMVMDLNVLGRIVDEVVVAELDHRNLQTDIPWLSGRITTAEEIVRAIWERLEGRLERRLYRLRLYETAHAFVDYYGPNGQQIA
jgi:6-pyruvoyltetrahydropterin/6-carboxytetrahydropterin synthase